MIEYVLKRVFIISFQLARKSSHWARIGGFPYSCLRLRFVGNVSHCDISGDVLLKKSHSGGGASLFEEGTYSFVSHLWRAPIDCMFRVGPKVADAGLKVGIVARSEAYLRLDVKVITPQRLEPRNGVSCRKVLFATSACGHANMKSCLGLLPSLARTKPGAPTRGRTRRRGPGGRLEVLRALLGRLLPFLWRGFPESTTKSAASVLEIHHFCLDFSLLLSESTRAEDWLQGPTF